MKEEIEKLQKKISSIVEPIIESYECELLHTEITGSSKGLILRLYIDYKDWEIDQPSKVTLNLCSSISREISALLDVEDPISTSYNLEISSPGVERILAKKEHFEKAIGYNVKILLKEPFQNRKRIIGEVKEVDDEGVTIEEDKNRIKIPYRLIKKGNLKVF